MSSGPERPTPPPRAAGEPPADPAETSDPDHPAPDDPSATSAPDMTPPGDRTSGPRKKRGKTTRSRPRRLPSVGRLVAALVLLALGAVLGLLCFQFLFMPLAVGHGKEVLVPNVTGLDLARATRTLGTADLVAHESSVRVSPDWPSGVVLEQAPPEGFRTRRGRTVHLVVSAGRGEVEVPSVHGESLRHAQIMLTREGIPVGRLSHQHANAPRNEVILVSPVVSTRLMRGQPVNLLLSDGPESEAYLLPDFGGGDPDAIARALRREGYVVEIIYPAGRFTPSRRVGGQVPPPGQRVVPGDKIRLMVGEG